MNKRGHEMSPALASTRLLRIDETPMHRQYIVTIDFQTFTLTVKQKSKVVWVASGEHLGKNIIVKNRTQNSALKRWVEIARGKRD